MSFDYKIDDGTINLSLVCANTSYYGYFAFDQYGNVDKCDGMTVENLGNGYYHVEFTIKNLTKYTGNTNADVIQLFIRGNWTDGSGEIKNLTVVQ